MKHKEVAELKALESDWSYILRRIIYCGENSSGGISDIISHSYRPYAELMYLEADFNDLVSRTTNIIKNFDISEEVLPKKVKFPIYTNVYSGDFLNKGEVEGTLQRMNQNVKRSLSILSNLTSEIVLSSEKEEELESLKNEIETTIKERLPLYSSDLNRSIESFRKGEFLGSALIAGRVLSVVLRKIERTLSKGNETEITIKEIKSFLTTKGVLEKSGGSKILEAMKLYRDELSHNVGTYPSPEECVIIINGTVFLLKKIIEKNIHLEVNL